MASMACLTVAIVLLVVPLPVHGSSKKFLMDESNPSHLNSKAFQNDIINAMGSMLGCGGQAGSEKMASIRKTLEPMWRTLPKTYERIDRRSLRYLVHRYFMQTSSLMIRGFEPTRPVNESHWGVADILSQMVPAYVESVLESNHHTNNGFSLDDAINMVAMLDQLIFDSESRLLSKVYKEKKVPIQSSITEKDLMKILETYLIQWMLEIDGDSEDIMLQLQNRTVLLEVVPLYDVAVGFAEGRMKTLQYAHQHSVPKGRSQDTWAAKLSFEDAHEIVGGITQTFQSFWQSECEDMKVALVAMDTHNTGRVPLSKFYNTAINTDWRFGESEVYLRELGALDESSSYGTQVIISNYIQATSNCIVSTPHYLVCCRNECEDLMGEIERAIGSPTATPLDLLQVVGNMTTQTVEEDDEPPQLAGALEQQLEEIAKLHEGMVPLHGRLFSQWLHYVFPRECAFPHRMGMVTSVTPVQYGEDYVASISDMKKHAADANASGLPNAVDKEELQWMSQWSDEEEFIVDYSSEFAMSWKKRLLLGVAGMMFLVFGITGGVIGCSRKTSMHNKKCWV